MHKIYFAQKIWVSGTNLDLNPHIFEKALLVSSKGREKAHHTFFCPHHKWRHNLLLFLPTTPFFVWVCFCGFISIYLCPVTLFSNLGSVMFYYMTWFSLKYILFEKKLSTKRKIPIFRPDHIYFSSGPHIFIVRTTHIFRPDHAYFSSGPHIFFVRTTHIFRPDHTYFSSGPHIFFVRTTHIFRPDHKYFSFRPYTYFSSGPHTYLFFSYFTRKLPLLSDRCWIFRIYN